jgi:acetyl-CoA carboxylase biotin carboxylase subunit
MTIKEIKELLDLFNESGVGELEVERAESRVRIRKARTAHEIVMPPAPSGFAPAMAPAHVPVPAPSSGPGAAPAKAIDSEHVLVKSPIVGTYYESPSPGSASFVNVGDAVEPGQVLCIIESMKLMNEIEAEVAGVIAAKLVENGKPVEYGEALFSTVMLKASAGGGGRGMRVVRNAEDLPSLLGQAQSEATAAFSNGEMYMEKLVEDPRHIEFQILADQHGNVEVLGERECSIQRRHQKLIEEAPSAAVSPELRKRIGDSLKVALKKIGYTNAGTVEFLMDSRGQLYFIEVNARIQVEHPVTEMVTGVDLVKGQIRVAAGESLDEILTGPIEIRGHAIECRVNAEHPETFVPSPGRITALNLPGGAGIRVDTGAYHDGVIPPYYDSLVAKLIAYGSTREEAIARMKRALSMFVVEGIYTSIPLHQRILNHPDFVAAKIDTGFLARSGFIPDKK